MWLGWFLGGAVAGILPRLRGTDREGGSGMKVKFNVARGGAVYTYKNDDITLEGVLALVANDFVIGITITKQTPAQYLKTQHGVYEIEDVPHENI